MNNLFIQAVRGGDMNIEIVFSILVLVRTGLPLDTQVLGLLVQVESTSFQSTVIKFK